MRKLKSILERPAITADEKIWKAAASAAEAVRLWNEEKRKVAIGLVKLLDAEASEYNLSSLDSRLDFLESKMGQAWSK